MPTNADPSPGDYDVIVIGGGLVGVYAVYRFRNQGLRVLAIESAPRAGGVWYHNRYPGARVDVESTQYCYFFSEELYREWKWPERYATQPELEKYINHVAERFSLNQHFRFNTRVSAVRRLADENQWLVETDQGDSWTCQFVVTAMGNLTVRRRPDFPGLDEFEGEWVQTSHWPERKIEFKDRRIGVIGTGSSGIQSIPVLAKEARHLTVFQRTPNFVVPAQNRLIPPEEIEAIADRLPEYHAGMLRTRGCTYFPSSYGDPTQYSEEEREEILERQWQAGGHSLSFTFDNMQTDLESNKYVADFVRSKIRKMVKDPETAETLCPYDHPIGSRRLCVDIGYYETYNRPNVSLVDLRKDPILRFTRTGIQTEKGHHALDLVVFAIGFHSFTGTLIAADIRNEKGETIISHWKPGWKTVMGFMTTDFPNLFMACGPGGITLSANVFPSGEHQINWIADCIAYMKERGYSTVEPKADAQANWVEHVEQVTSVLHAVKIDRPNWLVQKDPETGKRICMTFLGGFDAYVDHCTRSAQGGYPEFAFS